MLHTIINLDDVFYDEKSFNNVKNERSSNPYDYIRTGWFVDNSALFEGVNHVNFSSNYSSHISGCNIHSSVK
ncbi:MAG: hypothetical protein IJR70_02335 [Eubacterium sp.]|nr:hypothetical protein [Eubacterium sp.]